MFKSVQKFVSYWYFRYLLVSELYMVEKWERAFIHVFLALLFISLWYFNTKVVLNLTEMATSSLFPMMDLSKSFNMDHATLQNGAQSNIMGEL